MGMPLIVPVIQKVWLKPSANQKALWVPDLGLMLTSSDPGLQKMRSGISAHHFWCRPLKPGSPKEVRDALRAIRAAMEHASSVLARRAITAKNGDHRRAVGNRGRNISAIVGPGFGEIWRPHAMQARGVSYLLVMS